MTRALSVQTNYSPDLQEAKPLPKHVSWRELGCKGRKTLNDFHLPPMYSKHWKIWKFNLLFLDQQKIRIAINQQRSPLLESCSYFPKQLLTALNFSSNQKFQLLGKLEVKGRSDEIPRVGPLQTHRQLFPFRQRATKKVLHKNPSGPAPFWRALNWFRKTRRNGLKGFLNFRPFDRLCLNFPAKSFPPQLPKNSLCAIQISFLVKRAVFRAVTSLWNC